MKNTGFREKGKRLLVLLLFVVFGFCIPGYAAPNESASIGRSGS